MMPLLRASLLLAALGAALAASAQQTLYVADFGGNSVQRIDPNGVRSTFVTGILEPGGLAFDAGGNLFVSTGSYSDSIVRVAPGGATSTFASNVYGSRGLAFDAGGDLYAVAGYSGPNVSDSILRLSPDGARTTLATGLPNYASGLTFDAAGNLYVAIQAFNSAVLRITPGGSVSTFASGLNYPSGLAFDSAGNLFVVTYRSSNLHGPSSIVRITPGGVASTFAADQPDAIDGLTFDSAGNLYASSYFGGTITRYTPSGASSIFATGLQRPMFMAFGPNPVPEPSALLALGLPALALLRRRKRA